MREEDSESVLEERIEETGYDVTQEGMEAFRACVDGKHIKGTPPTFATLFRKTEYAWLDRLSVNLKHLLHGDQEYEYHRPIVAGQRLKVCSTIAHIKERNVGGYRTRWIRVLSEILDQTETALVTSRTSFVVREPLQ